MRPVNSTLFKTFQAFFADKIIIDRETPVVLQTPEAAANVKFERRTDKITLHQYPENPEYWRLDLPAGMVPPHLHTVKNIHGRRWNSDFYYWEVPATKLTARFLKQYLPGIVEWTFQPGEGIPEQLSTAAPQYQKQPIPPAVAQYEAAVTALEQTLTFLPGVLPPRPLVV